MGTFLSQYKNISLSARTIVLFAAVLAISFIGIIFTAPQAHAADAEFTTGEKTSILYQGKAYNGPNTNEEKLGTPTGWKPSNKDGDTYGVKYYIQEGNGGVVIWFEKDSNNAHWSEIDAPNGQPRQYWKLKNTRNITVSINRDIAQRDAMKSVFKNSVATYANNVCSKAPFAGNSSAQRECRDTVSSKFDSCWTKWTNPDDFTIANTNKPADGVPVDDIANCIAESEIGKVAGYRQALEAARDNANTQGADAYNNAIADDAPEDGETGSTCRIDGIGWLLCPVVTITAGIIDGAYNMVSLMLSVQPITTSGDTKPIYDAWSIMRNFANITFVIAFLIIVFSQVTSIGISNYGVKKLIPRLIMAAIFVNISFWVCAIAVDISNILGTSFKSLFDNIGGRLASPNDGVFTGENPWMNAAGYVVAGGVAAGIVMYTTLAALLPALVTVLFAIVTVFLVLTLRQALIILLIVISPLAFVAMLLPNTQNWFTKWRQLFQTLLLMFPIIAVIFGASAFASEIIMKAAGDNVALQIMGAAVSIIPLAITPIVMKTAGGLLNRFGGIVNNPNRGPFDKLRKSAEGLRDHRQEVARGRRLEGGGNVLKGDSFGKVLGGKDSRRRRTLAYLRSGGATGAVNRDQKRKFAKAIADENAQMYFAERANRPEGENFAKSITGNEKMATSLQASAQSAVDKIANQDKESRIVLFRAKHDPREIDEFANEFKKAVESDDIASARAAADILMNSGSKGIATLHKTIGLSEQDHPDIMNNTKSGSLSSMLRQDINRAGLKGKDNALAMWSFTGSREEGKAPPTLTELTEDTGTYAGLTARELVGQSGKNFETGARALSPKAAQDILNNQNLAGDIDKTKRAILEEVAAGSSATTTQPTTAQSTQSSAQTPPSSSSSPSATQATPAATGSNRETVEQALKQAAAGSAGTQPFVVDSQGATELKIDHSEAPTQSIPTATQPSAAQAAPTAPSFEDITRSGGWTPATPSATQAAPSQTPPSTTQQTVNQTINQTNQQTVNETNNFAPSSPATGRRSSGTPFDQPSSSTSNSTTGRRRATPSQPPREADSSFLPPQTPGTGPSDIPDWFNK